MKRGKQLKHRAMVVFISVLFIITFCLFPGCEEAPTPSPGRTIMFQSKVSNLFSLTIGENADVYAATYQDGIARYTPDGDLLEEYPGTERIYGLQYASGLLYGYHNVSRDIVEFNPNSKDIRVVYADFPADEIRNMAIVDNKIYLIVVPSYDDLLYEQEDDGYMSYHEEFYSIDIHSGELTRHTEIPQPISLYHGSDGSLYVYAHPNGNFVLYRYDTSKGAATQVDIMDDVGYLYEFAYENGSLVFFSALGNIRAKRMSDGLVYTCADTFPVGFGGFFTHYEGSLVFLEQFEPDDTEGDDAHGGIPSHLPRTSICTLNLNADLIYLMNPSNAADNTGELVEYKGDILISAAHYGEVFSIDTLRNRSGIWGTYIPQPVYWDEYQEFLTSILAGDDTVDIYVLNLNSDVSRALYGQGGYVPLTDSEPIRAYLDQCFDWVGDAARTPDGEIWMLPLYYQVPALLYIPENIDHFGIDPADLYDFNSYLQTVERLNQEKGHYTTHATLLASMEYYWFCQYEMTYCDYPNKTASFNTDIFRNYFETMWEGWHRYGDPELTTSHHPILQRDYEWLERIDEDSYIVENDTKRVVFKLDILDELLTSDLAGWRALPMPRLTDAVQRNYFGCLYAVVNPYGKNKELAIEFLEAAAANMISNVNRPVFVIEDISAYEGYYDMSLPIYRDIHNIYRDGATLRDLFSMRESEQIIDDYQDGTVTLQQAVDEIQRKAEFWLNE